MSEKTIKPTVGIVNEKTAAETNELVQEPTEEEIKNQIRLSEEDLIQGLIKASGYTNDETQLIQIARNGKLFFEFSVRPLSEEEYDKCKKKWTHYVRNKHFGMKLPEETNNIKYRAALIHTATVAEDREKLWDNKKVWEALSNNGLQILSGLDVIEYCLKAGEKDRVLEVIDNISGYDNNIEELVKN